MKLEVEKQDDLVILRPQGQLDAITAPIFQEALAPVLAEEPNRVILDLTGSSYISSAGLRALIVLAKAVMKQGKLATTGLNANVREVFQLAGFDKIMSICDDLDAAKAKV